MKICESCATENFEDAKVCKECGEKLTKKNSNIKQQSFLSSKRIILILSLSIIILVGIYFIFTPTTDKPIDIDNPQILIDKIIINTIEKDWLENNSWQVSTTIHFHILNSNNFDVNITNIIYSVDLLDENIYSRIYDGSSNEHIIKSDGELNIVESFWFLSEDDGLNNLKSENLHYKVQGTAFYNVKVSSSYTQYGSFQFIGEV